MAEHQAARPLWRRPLIWVLLYGALVAYGLYAFWRIPVEVLPRFNFPQISVVTHLQGATTSELESLVAWPLEGQILALPNLVSVRSVIGNGTVQTDVRFQEGTNIELDLQAVNGAIDRARAQLPPSVRPLAQIMGNAINEVADFTLEIPAGIAPAQVQRDVMANIVPALRSVTGVQLVEVYGTGDEAIWVQPRLPTLHRYGISIAAITQAIGEQVLLNPAGYISEGHQDVLIEARHLPVHLAQVEQIPIPGPSGPIPLRRLGQGRTCSGADA